MLDLASKRQVIAQEFAYSGCCCGAVDRGFPEAPIEWVTIASRGGLEWFGEEVSGPGVPRYTRLGVRFVETYRILDMTVWFQSLHRSVQPECRLTPV